ncbi:MAG: DUF512 domain-containing protein [Halanaerobiales bacterium]|nr:DUF512 domain-containing protein [Halanaerobiales bacterium]
MMDSRLKYMLLKTVQDDQILPITSVCNLHCIFCSHHHNPPELEVYELGHLPLALISELMDYLPKQGAIVIGESATRIVEGDPLAHPDFSVIITMLRQRFPTKLIKITTNGSFFDEANLKMLAESRPLELNLSLNCASPAERAFLMGDKKPELVFQGLELIREKALPFHGSIVAVPQLLEQNGLARTVELLAQYHPLTVRVILPGYTKYAARAVCFEPDGMINRLQREIAVLTEKYNFPLIMEPPLLKDLSGVIKGIIPETPAAQAGLQRGDMVVAVNGQAVISRVDLFNQVLALKNPLMEIKRGDSSFSLELEKAAGERSGLVVDYDLDPGTIKRLKGLLVTGCGEIAVITSRLAAPLLAGLVSGFGAKNPEIQPDLVAVKNNFFGGSICCAGLLVNDDISKAIREKGKKYDLLLLPGIIYNSLGNDLTGKNYKKLEEELKTGVIIG